MVTRCSVPIPPVSPPNTPPLSSVSWPLHRPHLEAGHMESIRIGHRLFEISFKSVPTDGHFGPTGTFSIKTINVSCLFAFIVDLLDTGGHACRLLRLRINSCFINRCVKSSSVSSRSWHCLWRGPPSLSVFLCVLPVLDREDSPHLDTGGIACFHPHVWPVQSFRLCMLLTISFAFDLGVKIKEKVQTFSTFS